MGSSQAGVFDFTTLLPLIIMAVIFGVFCRLLAKDKGRNENKWTVLAIIPIFQIFVSLYLIGATNLRTEEKLDKILAKLESTDA